MAVEPSKLKFELAAGQTAEQNLTIENISVREVIYQLYFDELDQILSVDQPTLRLGSGQKGAVKVSAKPGSSGIFATNLSIVGQELDRRQFNVAFGAKVPITLEISENQIRSLSFGAKTAIIIWLVLMAVTLLLLFLKRRKRHSWQEAAINLLHRRPWWKNLFD